MDEITCSSSKTISSTHASQRKLVIATRLHLGNASAPPSSDKIRGWLQNLYDMAVSVQGVTISCSYAIIAVDAGRNDRIPNYDYVQAIQEEANHVVDNGVTIVILPVTPWGKFVPALNALVYHAHTELNADQILMVSAEVSVSAASIQTLSDHITALASSSDDNLSEDSYVLVAGAALEGHLYHDSLDNTSTRVPLNGRTCPWNTLAMWNVPKLALTGFLPVSDVGTMAGVEECVAIAVHQQLFSSSLAKAKLVKLPDVSWNDDFEDDPERRQWHERKMKSKLERAEAQLKSLQLLVGDESIAGIVEHC